MDLCAYEGAGVPSQGREGRRKKDKIIYRCKPGSNQETGGKRKPIQHVILSAADGADILPQLSRSARHSFYEEPTVVGAAVVVVPSVSSCSHQYFLMNRVDI